MGTEGGPDVSERTRTEHVDGSAVFQSKADRHAEAGVAAELARVWRCELVHFGELCELDWYAVRDGRMAGVIECKVRKHPQGRFETVFLSVRKWLALNLANVGLGVPAIFVVSFDDAIRWKRIGLESGGVRLAGWSPGTRQAVSDFEPVIEVPVVSMQRLA